VLVDEQATFMHLTPREKEVLSLLLAGSTNREIAVLLGISAYTVRDHVSALLRKGRARNRMELALSPLPSAPVVAAARPAGVFI